MIKLIKALERVHDEHGGKFMAMMIWVGYGMGLVVFMGRGDSLRYSWNNFVQLPLFLQILIVAISTVGIYMIGWTGKYMWKSEEDISPLPKWMVHMFEKV